MSAMLHAVAASRLPVCSQQQGEPDLTEPEKVAILGQLYHEKPLVFLERFRTGLREEHLACFGHLRGDHRADFYCAEVARQGTTRPRTLRTRLRNRRYAALRELIQGVGAHGLRGRGDCGTGSRNGCESRNGRRSWRDGDRNVRGQGAIGRDKQGLGERMAQAVRRAGILQMTEVPFHNIGSRTQCPAL